MSWPAVLVLCLGVTSTGCRSPGHPAGDPMLGPVNPPGINGEQLPRATSKTLADAPAAATVQSSTTPAGLANNSQLPGGRPLVIGDGQSGPNWQLTNVGKGAVPAQNAASQKPTVQPVPRDPPPSPSGLVPSSWTTSDTTTESLLAPLKARGLVGEQHETTPEGIRFSCFLPSRSSPANLRQYEVTAPDLAAAVQAVLRQIDGSNP